MKKKHMLVLFFFCLLSGCSSPKHVEQEKHFTKINWNNKMIMRKVVVDISDDGKIIIPVKSYENLSKNIEDIYKNKVLLEEALLFYEAQMF